MTDDEARAILKAAMERGTTQVEWDNEHDCPTWLQWVGPPLATLNGYFGVDELRAVAHFARKLPRQEEGSF